MYAPLAGDNWEKGDPNMKLEVDLLIKILTLMTLAVGIYFAIRRFGLKRERFAFATLSIGTESILEGEDLVLVVINVHLENRGDTRINARRRSGRDDCIYSEGPDKCLHAGTLKIRAVPSYNAPTLFDWYSLEPLQVLEATRLEPKEPLRFSPIDLEQVNYLDEFQDPTTDYREVDFWAEPHESYDLTIPLWLHPGIYAAKAFFLGPESGHGEEEYWSYWTIFAAGRGVGKFKPPATT